MASYVPLLSLETDLRRVPLENKQQTTNNTNKQTNLYGVSTEKSGDLHLVFKNSGCILRLDFLETSLRKVPSDKAETYIQFFQVVGWLPFVVKKHPAESGEIARPGPQDWVEVSMTHKKQRIRMLTSPTKEQTVQVKTELI